MRALKMLSFVALATAFVGCQKEKSAPRGPSQPKTTTGSPTPPAANQPKPGDNKPILNIDPGQSAAMHVIRAKDIQALKGDMNQLGQFYIQYATENGRGPMNWQEFKGYMGNDGARYAKHIESDKVAVNYGVQPSSNTIVAYEKKPDLNGLQVVVFGDKRVESLTPEKLKQALQNR